MSGNFELEAKYDRTFSIILELIILNRKKHIMGTYQLYTLSKWTILPVRLGESLEDFAATGSTPWKIKTVTSIFRFCFIKCHIIKQFLKSHSLYFSWQDLQFSLLAFNATRLLHKIQFNSGSTLKKIVNC